MAFEVPPSKASLKQNQFEFSIGGKAYTACRAKFLPIGLAEAMDGPQGTTIVLDVFGKAGTKQGDAVRGLDAEQFEALIEAWRADSGVGMGESEASSS